MPSLWRPQRSSTKDRPIRYFARYIGTGKMRITKKVKKPAAFPSLSDYGGYDYAEFAPSSAVRVVGEESENYS